MKLVDMIAEEDILVELSSTSKEGVIEELVNQLVATKKIAKENKEAAIQEILEREALGSTGIGNGLAIPHNKKSKITNTMVGAFGRSTHGVDYGSIDGENSYIFFLFFVSQDMSTREDQPHLKILKKLSLLGRDSNFCRFLKEAKSQKEIHELLEEIDEKMVIA
ncbi:MAG: PTS sugar transporter subunit IIA [Planctomycetota bacterium]|nr:MAG: PTS sugar transporter subunit IIA [Planctomycetota bacterium]